MAELLDLAEKLGPSICSFKTHCDIVRDWTPAGAQKLVEIAEKHNFVIFEDRKFADIGNTVHEQLCGGVYAISSWADFVNAHILPGPGVISGLKKASAGTKCTGLILLAQMSSEGNLLTEDYANKAVSMAEQNEDYVFGESIS